MKFLIAFIGLCCIASAFGQNELGVSIIKYRASQLI